VWAASAGISPADLAIAGILAVAVGTDLRSRRIPNLLTFGVMLGALLLLPLLALLRGGVDAVPPALLGALLGIAAAFVPGFLLWNLGGAMRAGDVKLLMALGALIGPLEGLRLFALVLVLQIPVALFQLARAGRLRSLFSVIRAGVRRDAAGPRPLEAPFAGVIAAGYLVSRLFPQLLRFWS
jgi:prepilin peptidase CpaA